MKCDPGDLAVILPGGIPENVGAFVTVIHPYAMHPEFGLIWWVRAQQPLLSDSGAMVREGYIADKLLDPIRPPKPQQHTKTATPITEVTPA